VSWKEVRLEDITSIIGDGLHGTPAYVENGEYYFINGNNLEDGKIILKNETKRISEQEYNKIKKNLSNRTILIGINGTLGNLAIYNNEKVALGKSACYLNIKNDVNKLFVYYILKNYDFQDYAQLFATGATIKNLSLKAIRNYKFKLPSLNIQQKIVNLISNYDNLIENNNKRIKLLENMAEELYKEWFVRLRFPNYQNTKIIDGIPDGWEEKIANDFFDISIGKTPPRIEPQWFEDIKSINNTKWLSIKDIGNCGMFNLDSNEYLTNESISKFNVKVVPIGTILLSFKLTIGKICIVTSEVATNEAIAHFLFNSRNEIYREYLYLFFDNYNFQLLGNTSSIATAINSKIVKAMKIIIPNKIIIKEFSNFIKPIFNEIQTLQKKNQNLKETRDLLLPRLISGKLDIKDLHIV
jgi:type I restriction enzyme, S subunit